MDQGPVLAVTVTVTTASSAASSNFWRRELRRNCKPGSSENPRPRAGVRNLRSQKNIHAVPLGPPAEKGVTT